METVPRRHYLYDGAGSRQRLGRPFTVKQALKVVQKSRKCKTDSHSEASWSCHVHMPLLEKSLELCTYNEAVGAELL